MSERKYDKYVVSEMRGPQADPERVASYARVGKRIFWIDEDIIEGATQINFSWYLHPTLGISTSHTHEYDEFIGFIGSDSENPTDMGGEVEFWLEDEKYVVDKSTIFFAPRGLKHCPLRLIRVDRPIFHFTAVNGGKYVIKPS